MRKSSRADTPRPPGRPSADLAIRERLLQVARSEFAAQGFGGVSVAVIARDAGATPAMVHYYFGTKRGLYRAVLEQALGPFLARLEAGLDETEQAGDPVATFLRSYMGFLARSPDVPALILRDVLSPGGQMREEFVSGFARRAGHAVRNLIRRAIDAGRLRRDLDPDLATLSLLSMAVFPFMSAPVARQVLDYRISPEEIEPLVEHTLAMFYRGAGAGP